MPPLAILFDAARLWTDASTVIWLRTMRIMQGGALAQKESRLMVDEKLAANALLPFALWPAMLAGAEPEKLAKASLGHYGKRVRANRRRLGKAKR